MAGSFRRYGAIVVIILVLVIVAGAALLVYRQPWDRPPVEIVLAEPSCRVTFCVYGEVESPGIYRLDECGLCIEDAIEAAGGGTSNADYHAVTLRADLHNGDVIHVPRRGDVPQRVNINTAGAWLLDALPGIGPTLAERIVDYRDRNGPFGTVDELMMVEGIGEATYDGLKDLVKVY